MGGLRCTAAPVSFFTCFDEYTVILAWHAGESVKPMWYDSFYVSMLSEKYKTGKPQFFKAFVKGGFSNFKAIFNREKCSSVIYVISTLPPKNLIPGNLTLSTSPQTSPHATSPQPLSGGEGTNLRASIKDQK